MTFQKSLFCLPGNYWRLVQWLGYKSQQTRKNTTICWQEWQKRWARAKEDTSSSESGLHFGHYKAGAQSLMISHLHALKATIILKRGCVIDIWYCGLSVMLEKMFGCTLVNKLRTILLMDAAFNFANKKFMGIKWWMWYANISSCQMIFSAKKENGRWWHAL